MARCGSEVKIILFNLNVFIFALVCVWFQAPNAGGCCTGHVYLVIFNIIILYKISDKFNKKQPLRLLTLKMVRPNLIWTVLKSGNQSNTRAFHTWKREEKLTYGELAKRSSDHFFLATFLHFFWQNQMKQISFGQLLLK